MANTYSHWMMSKLTLSVVLYALSTCTIDATKETHYEHRTLPEGDEPKPIEMDQPTPKCALSMQLSQFDGENKMAIEEPPSASAMLKHQWHMMSDPMDGKLDDFWPGMMKHMIGNEHHEDQHNSISQDLPINGRQHDPVYELVNHRFWHTDTNGHQQQQQQRQQNNHLEDQNNNWQTWTKVISYFPSGQEQLRRQRPSIESPQILTTQQLQPNLGSGVEDAAHQQSFAKLANDDTKVLSAKNQATDSPALSMIVSSKKSEDLNELDQQDQMRLLEPIMMHIEDKTVKIEQQQPSIKQLGEAKQTTDAENRSIDPPLASQRFRDSLLKAADNARHLSSSTNNNSVSNADTNVQGRRATIPSFNSTLSGFTGESLVGWTETDQPDYRPQVWSQDDQIISWRQPNQTDNNPMLTSRREWQRSIGMGTMDGNFKMMAKPRFLGFGQLQRNDPFNGNGRTQARLSCQFSDPLTKNITISNVEWAKFDGQYNPDKEEPDFECQQLECRLVPIKTDVLTTVHPRPAIQNYINTLAPSYSMTLHEVDHNHHGVYRCSAVRQSSVKTELVYRIIPYE